MDNTIKNSKKLGALASLPFVLTGCMSLQSQPLDVPAEAHIIHDAVTNVSAPAPAKLSPHPVPVSNNMLANGLAGFGGIPNPSNATSVLSEVEQQRIQSNLSGLRAPARQVSETAPRYQDDLQL